MQDLLLLEDVEIESGAGAGAVAVLRRVLKSGNAQPVRC